MAHPHNEHRAHRVEKSRVAHITKGYATGGAVAASGIRPKARRANGGSVKTAGLTMAGEGTKHRADKRARGGKIKGKKGTTINIINTPGHALSGAPPVAPALPPRPPAAPMAGGAPAPGGAMAPPPGAPPMPIRRRGGVARASGGSVKSGPAWEEGVRNGTPPKNSPGKNDGKNIGRGRVVTFKAGGRIVAFRAGGGKVESPEGIAKATRLPGGSGGARARLAKEKRVERDFHPSSKIYS